MEKPLPKNWLFTSLQTVAKINPTLNKTGLDDNLLISFVPMPAVEAETGKIDVKQLRKFGEVKKGYTSFQMNDVLFAKITPCMENGKMAVAPDLHNHLGFGSTEFHVLRAHNGIEAKFIYYFVSSGEFRQNCEHNMTGAVGQRRVPTSYLEQYHIPIPPTNEQRRIVAKIEELFSELDKGIENLKAVHEQLKVYRQAVLKYAFEGKLTEKWRKRNKGKIPSSEKLIDWIRSEREAFYNQQLKKWENDKAKAKVSPKPRKPKDLKPFKGDDFSWLFDLPKGWIWERLGWMSSGIEYGTSAKSVGTGKVPVLRMGNIQNMKFDWDDLVYTADKDEISTYLLHAGDVLFNRTNSPELVGKTAIYKGERPAIFAGYLIRVNNLASIVDSQYLNFFLNCHIAKQHGNSVKTDGVNQSNINGDKLANYPFPFCSLEEQKVIVAVLEEQISLIDKMETDVDSQIKKSDALRQAILKKAFSGQLVNQNPKDEPADILLEHIRAEKEDTRRKYKGKRSAA